MKSYLPIFLLVGGLVIISLIGFAIFNLRSRELLPPQEEKVTPTVSMPYVTLTPDSAGRELQLNVSKIDSSVASLEYELVYNTAAGVLQGVPGAIQVFGQGSITRTLTLGTCSSGVCRYDKGVRDITLTIKLRNTDGKLLNKFATGVALLTKTRELVSTDDKFKLTLDRKPTGFFVIIETGGVPDEAPGKIVAGPYGVFASGDTKQGGTVTLEGGRLYLWDGKSWQELSDGKTKALGLFITLQ